MHKWSGKSDFCLCCFNGSLSEIWPRKISSLCRCDVPFIKSVDWSLKGSKLFQRCLIRTICFYFLVSRCYNNALFVFAVEVTLDFRRTVCISKLASMRIQGLASHCFIISVNVVIKRVNIELLLKLLFPVLTLGIDLPAVYSVLICLSLLQVQRIVHLLLWVLHLLFKLKIEIRWAYNDFFLLGFILEDLLSNALVLW